MIADHMLLNAVLRTDFYAFARRVFREMEPGQMFEDSWAVEAICHALEEVAHGRRRRQIIAVPPRSLESICASVALPAWILGHDPTAKIIAVSYAQDLADRFSAMSRQVMKSGWYRELFPGTAISPFKDSESYFRTTAGGFRDATSVGGTLTGKGGTFIIIDDPGKADGAMSQSIRQGINDWYGRTLVSRLDNKLTGSILLVMQRLHLEDLVGHVQRYEDWAVLTLPAIAAMEERIPLGYGRFHLRPVGSVLRPNSDTLEVLRQYELTMGSHAFSAQYLQRPIPSNGEIIKLEWFNSIRRCWSPHVQSSCNRGIRRPRRDQRPIIRPVSPPLSIKIIFRSLTFSVRGSISPASSARPSRWRVATRSTDCSSKTLAPEPRCASSSKKSETPVFLIPSGSSQGTIKRRG